MSFNDFVHEHNLKKQSNNVKIHQIFLSLGLSDVGFYLRGGLFISDIGIVNLHPFQGTHWILYIHKCYFDSYDFVPPQKLSKFAINGNGFCLY